MSDWEPRKTIPEDGAEVLVQSVGGKEPDDAPVFFEGKASFKEFTIGKVIDPITGAEAIPESTSMRWVRSDTRKCVPGRIVRWKHVDG